MIGELFRYQVYDGLFYEGNIEKVIGWPKESMVCRSLLAHSVYKGYILFSRFGLWHGAGIWNGVHLLQRDPGMVHLLPGALVHLVRAAVGIVWKPLEHPKLPEERTRWGDDAHCECHQHER